MSLYETAATFGGQLSSKPQITSVTIPEAKKRRQPTKHYVSYPAINYGGANSKRVCTT